MRTGRGITIQQGPTDDATMLRVTMMPVAQKGTNMKASTRRFTSSVGSREILPVPTYDTGHTRTNNPTGPTTQQ